MNKTRAALLGLRFIPAAVIAVLVDLLLVELIPVAYMLRRLARASPPHSSPVGDLVLKDENRDRHTQDIQAMLAMIAGRNFRPVRFSVRARRARSTVAWIDC